VAGPRLAWTAVHFSWFGATEKLHMTEGLAAACYRVEGSVLTMLAVHEVWGSNLSLVMTHHVSDTVG
jgi:hypothetical protein